MSRTEEYYLYGIASKEGTAAYIGSTKVDHKSKSRVGCRDGFKIRVSNHFSKLRNQNHPNKNLQALCDDGVELVPFVIGKFLAATVQEQQAQEEAMCHWLESAGFEVLNLYRYGSDGKKLVDHNGEKHPSSKLTDADVTWLRQNHQHYTIERLAKHLGVSKDCVWNAIRGKSFKHLPPTHQKRQHRKLSHDDVRAIRGVAGIVSNTNLGRFYKVDQSTISVIINYKTYKEIQ